MADLRINKKIWYENLNAKGNLEGLDLECVVKLKLACGWMCRMD